MIGTAVADVIGDCHARLTEAFKVPASGESELTHGSGTVQRVNEGGRP